MKVLLFIHLLLCSAVVSADDLLPVEAWARPPLFSDVEISADGSRLAVIRNEPGGKSRLLVLDISSGKVLRSVETPPHADPLSRDRFEDVRWAGDGLLSYGFTATVPRNRVFGPDAILMAPWDVVDMWRRVSLDLESGENKVVHQGGMADGWLPGTIVLAPIEGDPGSGRVVFPQRGSSRDAFGLYRADLKTGQVSLQNKGVRDTEDFAINPRGQGVLRLDFDRVKETWRLLRIDGDKIQQLHAGTEAQGVPWYFGLLEDGTPAMLTRTERADRAALHALDSNDGNISLRTLVQDDVHDVYEAIFDPWTHAIVGARVRTPEGPREHFLSPDLATVRVSLEALLKGAYITLWNWSKDRSRFVLSAERSNDAGAVYLFDAATRQLSLIGTMYPELKTPAALGNSRAITFKAHDGRTINAVLTLPDGVNNSGLPTVVFAGGEADRAAVPGFSPLPSLFASRGFAVVEVDERGTYGWGREVEDAGLGAFATGVVDDFEDAAHALILAGIADGDRICAIGTLDGAYTAARAATRPGNPFDCLVSINGVLDLSSYQLHLGRFFGEYGLRRMEFRRRFGADFDSARRRKAASPAFNVEHLRGPALLVTTMSAVTLPESQAEAMANSARKAGKPVDVVRLPLVDANLVHEESMVISARAALEHLQRVFPSG